MILDKTVTWIILVAGNSTRFGKNRNQGVDWFKTCGLWKERGFNPQAGDIIFFDWKDKKTGIRNGQAEKPWRQF